MTGDRDRGAATVWAAGGIAALLALTTLIVGLGSAAVTRHRAAAAADLGALAAAVHAVEGQSRACDRAGWVVERHGALMSTCRLDGWDAVVEVSARPPEFVARFGVATARARAGPIDDG